MKNDFMKTTLSATSMTGLATLALGALATIGTASAQFFTVQELPIPAGYDSTAPTQINDQGYVVGQCSAGTGQPVATVWKGGTVTALGKLKDGTYSVATAINSSGTVVGDG